MGSRIDACITHRVKTQDVDHLVKPFTSRNESRLWQSEFWGKWIQGAIASYRYTKDPELLSIIQKAVTDLLKTQTADGYIGNYSPDHQLEHWDIWGRKYTLLGLLAYYDISNDKQVLNAAIKMTDHLIKQLKDSGKSIVKTGNYRGMPSSSFLEPVMFLYNRTGEDRFLSFAKYIVQEWETPDGPQLISKALDDIPVSQRFPSPATWWSWDNGQKAYEMMSCYEGLLELYKVTGNPLYISVVEKSVANIIKDEINIAGSGSAFECWYGGGTKQDQATYHTMETCVTFTWMKLCSTLLSLTGNTIYADQIEKTTYNALFASMKDDASEIAKYSPLEGCRHKGEEQCGMHINCCNANGPRAFALLPQVAYQVKENRINVNLFTTSELKTRLNGTQQVYIKQNTNYPVDGNIEMEIIPEKSARFTIGIRIPAWNNQVSLAVNGQEVTDITRGCYYLLDRTWNKGDKITLTLDLRAKLVQLNNSQAIQRGPIVLARDSRFKDGDVDEAIKFLPKEGYLTLEPENQTSPFAWMSFTTSAITGTNMEEAGAARKIHFCDFSSAGNTWSESERYRVWLPKPLNVMHSEYSNY